MSDQYSKSSSSRMSYDEYVEMSAQKYDSWGMLYSQFDVFISDINEKELEEIGQMCEVANLSPAVFPSPLFPVNGHIIDRNTRFMVPMVCQWAGKPNKPIINVWFLVCTGSPFTCLTVNSLQAILGGHKDIDETDRFDIAIQDQNSKIEC